MVNQHPFISIATPCWNSAKTIERTIRSVLAQSFIDYEYIIVDGGSTDGTLDIIKKYEPLFEGRMNWKSEPDKGLYDAFNKGVERSSGLYCWNVNSDDYIEPDALQKIYSLVQSKKWEKYPIIAGNMNIVDDKSGAIISTSKVGYENIKRGFKNDYIGVAHPATIVPKETYNRLGAFDPYYKIIGDTDWFHRVYEAGEQFAILDVVLTNMSDGGISYQFNFKRSYRDRIYFLNKFYKNPVNRFFRLVIWVKLFYSIKYSHRFRKNKIQ